MPRSLTLTLALIIAVLTLMPVSAGPEGPPGLDKLSHLIAFGALAVPLSWYYPANWRAVALAAFAYGGLIEIVQPYVGRRAEWADLLADGLGALAGAWIAAQLARRRRAG